MSKIEQPSLFSEPEASVPETRNTLPPNPSQVYRGDAYVGDLRPPYHEPLEDLDEATKTVGRAGVAAARVVLDSTKEKS